MLNLRKVLGAKPKEHVESTLERMFTPWGEQLDSTHVWEEHPNPQFQRDTWTPLNGIWQYAFVSSGHEPTADLEQVVSQAPLPQAQEFEGDIVVPFSPEAPLSGVERQLQPDELLWYRRMVSKPSLRGEERCLLHFQAVDYACAVRVNDQLAGTHEGGYLPFAFDITDYLSAGENELAVCVADPSEFGGHLRGKQRFDRGDIWYTAQSGIWQSVWMQVVPATHIERIRIEPDAKAGVLAIGAKISGDDSLKLRVQVLDDTGTVIAQGQEDAESGTVAVAMQVPDVRLWSPDNPYLYELKLTYGDDAVSSYCAFRTVEMGVDKAGHRCMLLNGSPLFIRGVLDQAYWSDGLMTAPCDEALVFDIKAMRDAGFNLMRKHIKVENARWYYHCDRLGMLVMQDMVQGGDPEIHTWDWSYKPTLFKFSWSHFRDDVEAHQQKLGAGSSTYREEWTRAFRETIDELRNHPSIISWALFNEGWGQFEARKADALARKLDPTRVIDAVSGWYDQGCGDFRSVHNYFRDLSVWRSGHGRAFFISEFGGYSHRVEGHSSLPECYGYEVYDDAREWCRAVRDLLAHMNSLQGKGLAGYVYTQVSDIEEETNGILTYDRRVNKFSDHMS